MTNTNNAADARLWALTTLATEISFGCSDWTVIPLFRGGFMIELVCDTVDDTRIVSLSDLRNLDDVWGLVATAMRKTGHPWAPAIPVV